MSSSVTDKIEQKLSDIKRHNTQIRTNLNGKEADDEVSLLNGENLAPASNRICVEKVFN